MPTIYMQYRSQTTDWTSMLWGTHTVMKVTHIAWKVASLAILLAIQPSKHTYAADYNYTLLNHSPTCFNSLHNRLQYGRENGR